MNPLELRAEMHHRIKNVIATNRFSTTSACSRWMLIQLRWTRSLLITSLSLRTSVSFVNIFISLSYLTMTIHDKKLRLGACGETELANAKQSLIMMMLVLSLKFLVGHLIFLLPL